MKASICRGENMRITEKNLFLDRINGESGEMN